MNQFDPVITERVPSDTLFAELFLAWGPNAIAGGSARLPTRPWMLLLDEASRVNELYRWGNGGAWERVLVPGHPMIDQVAGADDRRVSLAFDQAEQPITAFQRGGLVLVTRWDTVLGQYVQNVSFSGVDPVVFFDATVAEAGAYPIELVVEWLPTGQWFTPDEVIADSDALVFYLSTDRLRLLCRVQRQLFLTENELFVFDNPVILDRVVAADGRYQVLVSSADGRAAPDALVSDSYIGDRMLLARHSDGLDAGVQLEPIRVQSDTLGVSPVDGLAAGVSLEAIRIGQNIFLYAPPPEELSAGVELESIEVKSVVFVFTPEPEGIDAGVQLETIENRVNTVHHEPEPNGITAGVSLEAIRVQSI